MFSSEKHGCKECESKTIISGKHVGAPHNSVRNITQLSSDPWETILRQTIGNFQASCKYVIHTGSIMYKPTILGQTQHLNLHVFLILKLELPI